MLSLLALYFHFFVCKYPSAFKLVLPKTLGSTKTCGTVLLTQAICGNAALWFLLACVKRDRRYLWSTLRLFCRLEWHFKGCSHLYWIRASLRTLFLKFRLSFYLFLVQPSTMWRKRSAIILLLFKDAFILASGSVRGYKLRSFLFFFFLNGSVKSALVFPVLLYKWQACVRVGNLRRSIAHVVSGKPTCRL